MNVRLGNGLRTSGQFQEAFQERRCHMSYWARRIIDSSVFNPQGNEIDIPLVVVSETDLGLEPKEVFGKARQCGFVFPPIEVGPQLRLQYLDQPRDECLCVAAELATSQLFTVFWADPKQDKVGELWLGTNHISPSGCWPGGVKWVFQRC